MIQAILIFIILLIGFLTFKFYPIKSDTKSIVLSALLIVVTCICKRFFTVMIPFFGFESFKIGIEYIPLMLAGFLLTPSYAFLIGLACDLIGLIIVPTGFPFFGFTLSMILVALIPSVISNSFKKLSENVIIYITVIVLVILGFVGSTYVISLNVFKLNDTTINLSPIIKSLLIFMIIGVIAIVVSVIFILKKQVKENEMQSFALWALSVVLVEGICTVLLTPTWLKIMYSIPMSASISIRIVKEIFIMPLELFVGYALLKVVQKIYSNS